MRRSNISTRIGARKETGRAGKAKRRCPRGPRVHCGLFGDAKAGPMINAAIVGLGLWGCHLVRSVHDASERIRFTRAAERRSSDTAAFAARHALRLGDYDEILTDPTVDAIVIANTNSLHGEYARRAAHAGKHVFVEKPMALNARDARATVEACRRAGVVLTVGFNWRFHPASIELKRLADTSALGTILHVEGNYSGPSGYRRPPGHWRLSQAENPAGGVAARGIHVIDAMIHMCGRIGSVYARSHRRVLDAELDDTTSALFEFGAGMTGQLATMLATAEFWRLHVFGATGWAKMECAEHLPLSTLTTCSVDRELRVVTYPASSIEKSELEAFAASIEGRNSAAAAVDDAVHGIEVWEAIQTSVAAGTVAVVGREPSPASALRA